MYVCNICGGDFLFLIFEYNSVVCEKCSIRKNVSNCHELDLIPIEIEEAEKNLAEGADEDEDDEEVDLEEEDAEQLLTLIEQIKNPRIREDFMDLAEQYIKGD